MEYVYNESRPPVGRVYGVHPREGERYYLRLLLMKIPGPTSFDDLKKTYIRAEIQHVTFMKEIQHMSFMKLFRMHVEILVFYRMIKNG
jgi:hypothetical protein